MSKQRSLSWLIFLVVTVVAWTAEGAAERPSLVGGGGRMNSGVLTADDRGARYELPGGSEIRATPGTTFQVRVKPENLVLSRGERTKTYIVLLYAGRLDVRVPERSTTPRAVLVSLPKFMGIIVKNGSGSAVVDKFGITVVNRRGAALSQEGAAWKPLDAGKARTRSARDPVARPQPVIMPPEKLGDSALRAAFSGQASVCNLSWSAVEGAIAYDVELRDEKGHALAARRVEQPKLGCDFASVGPGVYTFRVRAVDRQGIESCEWSSRQIRVIGAELPAGAYFGSDGVAYLPRDTQVTFSHIGGLQMTYGLKSDYFVRAMPKVGLFRNGPVSVVFRDPMNGQKLNIALKPRDLRAEVELGPKTAVWPRDSVTATIKLQGAGQGQASVRPRMRVLLGLEPLAVRWRRQGQVWTAHIRPQAGPGPWVLRVEVTDQHGAFLGRSFLEIVSERQRRHGQ